jgi:hypothetical protein
MPETGHVEVDETFDIWWCLHHSQANARARCRRYARQPAPIVILGNLSTENTSSSSYFQACFS